MSESAAAACWICMDDGPDEAGKPTIRDCSCRGSDAGFAHISCIVEYATRKSSENRNYTSIPEFRVPWTECPNCKQMYSGQLRCELQVKFAEFTENRYPEFDCRRLLAYLNMLGPELGRERIDEVISKCTLICD
jgi:hypothetical protein